ncbi:MAG TPA: ABC transporter permease subunit [Myxococcales bacterium]|jgi:ABC-type transport system involved in multi-copper enzyme maturation permease subunit|nr:ABC transporter permease subunit [Myxococcales bacterium]
MISWPIAISTARERGFLKLPLFWMAGLFLMGLFQGGGSRGAEAFTGGGEAWLIFFVLILSGGLISDEVDSGHAQLVLLKPITRAQWVSGRFTGAAIVLSAGVLLSWMGSLIMAFVHGGDALLVLRLQVLPLALLTALPWMATAVALSVVIRGWANVGVMVGGMIAWGISRHVLPQLLLLKGFDVEPYFKAIEPYAGPQNVLKDLLAGTLTPSTALWNLFWLFAAWTLAVLLFDRRELARRRA